MEGVNAAVGLENSGNYCYQNAVLQALFYVPAIRDRIIEQWAAYSDQIPEKSVSASLRSIFLSLRGLRDFGSKVCRPDALRNFFGDQFGYKQQDAEEFFNSLIDKVHQESDKGKRFPSLKGLLSGECQVLWRLSCDCRYDNKRSFCHVPVPVSQSCATLRCALDKEFPEAEFLYGDDSKRCDRCAGKASSTKRESITQMPDVLVIHLKRFLPRGNKLSYSSKAMDYLTFPVDEGLDISGLMRDHANATATKQSRYELRSIVIHSGSSVDCGHYYAVTRNGDENQWMRVDDTYVTSLAKERIPSLAFGTKFNGKTSEHNTYGSPTAYMLFYSKVAANDWKRPVSAHTDISRPSPVSSPTKSEAKTFHVETQTARVSFSSGLSSPPPSNVKSVTSCLRHLLEPVTLKKVPKQAGSVGPKPPSPTSSPKHAGAVPASSPRHAGVVPTGSPRPGGGDRAELQTAASRRGGSEAVALPERTTQSQSVLSIPTAAGFCPKHSQPSARLPATVIDARTGVTTSAQAGGACRLMPTSRPTGRSQNMKDVNGSCRKEEASPGKVVGRIRIVF